MRRFLRLTVKNYVSQSRKPPSAVAYITVRNFCAEKAPARPEPKHDWNRAMSDAEKIVGLVFLRLKFSKN